MFETSTDNQGSILTTNLTDVIRFDPQLKQNFNGGGGKILLRLLQLPNTCSTSTSTSILVSSHLPSSVHCPGLACKAALLSSQW